MTEYSMPWDDTDIGDAAAYAPYDADIWQGMYMDLFEFAASQGVIMRAGSGLSCTLSGDDTPVVVTPGAAMIQGQYYKNTANVDVAIPRPITNPRNDRIVVQRVWATKESRITRFAGTEGAGTPALIESDGTVWQMPLAIVTVPVAGAMSIVDDRTYRMHPVVTERLGGSETDWDIAGAIWYKPGKVRIVAGYDEWTGTAANAGDGHVDFNTSFAKPPLVLLSQRSPLILPRKVNMALNGSWVNKFEWMWISTDGVTTYDQIDLHWIAIGEEA